jgi:hypothetical protein
MKLSIILSGVLLAVQQPVSNGIQDTPHPETVALPVVNHRAFQRGERLEYDLSYGWVDAGEAIIEITEEKRRIADRPTMHVVGTGNSLGAFNWFFKVRDRYETYIDEQGVFPWAFVRDIHEGGFEMQQHYSFNHYDQTVSTDKGKQYEVPLGVQDMISAFYRARALDFSQVKPGQVFEIQAFVDDEVWPLKLKYLRTEEKEVDMGTFNCMVFVPVVQTGRIFKEEEDLMVWVTADENKIPILAKAEVLVGSVRMEIREYHGLANPIAKR